MFKFRQFLSLCSNCLRRNGFTNKYGVRTFSSQKERLSLDDGPIKYTTSKARLYKAEVTRTGTDVERLWYEPYVLTVSLAVFLIYFCVLREENDVDKELSRSLFSRVEGLEETQLRVALKYNLDKGLDTKAIRERLEEIEKEKMAKVIVSE